MLQPIASGPRTSFALGLVADIHERDFCLEHTGSRRPCEGDPKFRVSEERSENLDGARAGAMPKDDRVLELPRHDLRRATRSHELECRERERLVAAAHDMKSKRSVAALRGIALDLHVARDFEDDSFGEARHARIGLGGCERVRRCIEGSNEVGTGRTWGARTRYGTCEKRQPDRKRGHHHSAHGDGRHRKTSTVPLTSAKFPDRGRPEPQRMRTEIEDQARPKVLEREGCP